MRDHFIPYGAVTFFLFMVILTLSGCAGLGKPLEPPRINVSNIRPQEMKALEAVFLLELRVFNTNDIPIVIKGVDCELDLNDKKFASGVSNKETEIPSYGSGIVPILVYSSVLDIFRGVMGMSGQEKLSYQIKGKVRIDAGAMGPSTVPFTSEGELSFDRFTN